MAAGGTYKIRLSNGQTLSVYQAASQAVNSNPVCTMVGAASSTTLTTDFAVSENCTIKDIQVASTLTAGGIEFYNVTESRRTQRGIEDLEAWLSTNTTRVPPAIGFRRGQVYRLIQTVAGNA